MTPKPEILVVDDDAAVRDVTGAMLRALGHEVLLAADAAAALSLVDAGKAFSLAIVDLTMPDMDGITLAAELEVRRPGVPIVLASGYGASVDDAIKARVTGVLEKPFGLAELRAAVEGGLGGEDA